MGKIVYLDCFSGASGDMFLGALLDVGLPIDNLRTALGSLALDKDGWSIEAERSMRQATESQQSQVVQTRLMVIITILATVVPTAITA